MVFKGPFQCKLFCDSMFRRSREKSRVFCRAGLSAQCNHPGEIPALLPDAESFLEEGVIHSSPGAQVGVGFAGTVSHTVGVPVRQACLRPMADWDQLSVPCGSHSLTGTWRDATVFPETCFQPLFGPAGRF